MLGFGVIFVTIDVGQNLVFVLILVVATLAVTMIDPIAGAVWDWRYRRKGERGSSDLPWG